MPETTRISLRQPTAADGQRLHRLVQQCPPLDTNSVYCNLLHCTHFSQTSVAAEMDGELVGFISGYIIPQRQDTLFVWQVAAHERARGQGLATRMLKQILQRSQCADIAWLETTVTPSNAASLSLFKRLASKLGAGLSSEILFDSAAHFGGEHESELLLRIGPLPAGN